jgi:chromosome segregation ATPase
MSQEKYIEYYVDVMSKTLQDSIVKSISLQANLKLTENIIKELQTKVEELTISVESSKKELENTKADKNANDNTKIQQLQNANNELNNTINNLKNQITDLSIIKSEYESVKHQLQHIDTFTNELNKTREELTSVHGKYGSEIKELNDQIEYLKLTPAKRKKIDEAKAAQTVVVSAELEELIVSDEIIKDGGSF